MPEYEDFHQPVGYMAVPVIPCALGPSPCKHKVMRCTGCLGNATRMDLENPQRIPSIKEQQAITESQAQEWEDHPKLEFGMKELCTGFGG